MRCAIFLCFILVTVAETLTDSTHVVMHTIETTHYADYTLACLAPPCTYSQPERKLEPFSSAADALNWLGEHQEVVDPVLYSLERVAMKRVLSHTEEVEVNVPSLVQKEVFKWEL